MDCMTQYDYPLPIFNRDFVFWLNQKPVVDNRLVMVSMSGKQLLAAVTCLMCEIEMQDVPDSKLT